MAALIKLSILLLFFNIFSTDCDKSDCDKCVKSRIQFGFNIEDVDEMVLSQIAKKLNKGNPIVLQETISKDRYHILSMTKIRQWTPNSNVRIWYGDPEWGLDAKFFKNLSFYTTKYITHYLHIFKF